MKPARDLYGFQQAGVEFLTKNHGGFLWDDPGLGKTTQAIVAARELTPRADDPRPLPRKSILVVCPNSLKRHWRKEIHTIYPEDSILVAGVGGRFTVYTPDGRHHEVQVNSLFRLPTWVICHYAGIRIGVDYYKAVDWSIVIADECHYIKNGKAKRTRAMWNIGTSPSFRIGLTATPYSRTPADLWSQLKWGFPHIAALHSYYRWTHHFVEFEEGYNPHTGGKYKRAIGGKNLDVLGRLLSKYGVCRTKAVVAPQLPPITDIDMPLQMTKRQRKVYNKLRDKSVVELGIRHADTGDYTPLKIQNVLVRLTRMEQWLSHPWTFDPREKGSRLEWLEEWSADYPYPAVIVARFKKTVKRLAALLGVNPVTGDITQKVRDSIVEQWQSGYSGYLRSHPMRGNGIQVSTDHNSVPQFLVGTIHTLATGLNLERAYALVCYDQVRSPILMQQVRERIHRITSDHPVEILYLYNEDTTNEVILQAFKKRWSDLQLVRSLIQLFNAGKDST